MIPMLDLLFISCFIHPISTYSSYVGSRDQIGFIYKPRDRIYLRRCLDLYDLREEYS